MSKAFANSIKKLLNDNGKTMKELADYVGCSASTVSMWCTENSEPRMSKVDKIAEFFHVSRAEVLGVEVIEETETNNERSAALILAYATKIAKLSKEQQDIIINIINQFEGK